ncbi:hypothetical protein ACA910_001851 [Epithemia clementina (nom. ined.)]
MSAAASYEDSSVDSSRSNDSMTYASYMRCRKEQETEFTGVQPSAFDEYFKPSAFDEYLLQTILRGHGTISNGLYCSMLKSQVGVIIKHRSPLHFQSREKVEGLFAWAIAKGLVFETGKPVVTINRIIGFLRGTNNSKVLLLAIASGEGASEMLSLTAPLDGDFTLTVVDSKRNRLKMEVSHSLPEGIDKIPKKVLEMIVKAKMPFVLVVAQKDFVPGAVYPKRTFVYSNHKKWVFLLHHGYKNAQQTVNEFPNLRSGVLLNWAIINIIKKECSMYGKAIQQVGTSQVHSSGGDFVYCDNCRPWGGGGGGGD